VVDARVEQVLRTAQEHPAQSFEHGRESSESG